MTYRIYLTLMSTITLIAFLAWIVVLFNIDPQDAGLFSSSIFYSSLSIASIGTISVIGTMIRMWIHSDELPVQCLRSLRQSTGSLSSYWKPHPSCTQPYRGGQSFYLFYFVHR